MMNHKLISVFFSIILFSSFLTLLPIVPAYSEPLVPLSSDFSQVIVLPHSVNYYTSYTVAFLDFSISQQLVNISYNGAWVSLSKPDFGVTGVTYQLLKNSSMVVMKWSKQNYYFAMGFDIQNINKGVKFGVQWNLDQPRAVTFHVGGSISYQTAAKFVFKTQTTGEDSLAFDWSDIRNVDFQINRLSKTITVNLPQSGYIDPLISLNDGVYWGQQYSNSASYFRLDNSSKRTAFSFTALWSKTITQIQLTGGEAALAPVYNVSIQSDSGGSPSGVYLGSGLMSNPTTASKTVTLTSGVALTAGTVYWVVIEYKSGTINSTHYWAVNAPSASYFYGAYARPFDLTYDNRFAMKKRYGSVWFGNMPTGNGWLIIASDGTVDGVPYYDQYQEATFTHTSFYGEIFTVPRNMNVSTLCFMKTSATGTQNRFIFGLIYNVTGGTILDNVTWANDVDLYAGWINMPLSSNILLKTGIIYRVAFQEGSSDSGIMPRVMLGSSTNVTLNKANFLGTGSVEQTTVNSGSSWTNATSGNELIFRFVLTNLPITTTTVTSTTTLTTTATTTTTSISTTTETSTTTVTNTTTLYETTTLTQNFTTTLTSTSTVTSTVTNTTTETETTTETSTTTETETTTTTKISTTTETETSTTTFTNSTTLTNCTSTEGGNLALSGVAFTLGAIIIGFVMIIILVSKKH